MDRFILESAHKKICIKGNNNNSLAVGLNHYLKYYCHTNVSWYASDSIDMPEELPVIPQPISIRSKCDNRFFLNYCTFGYTMPYWKWSDWERLIDWMALNGITMPLAISGQETVWYKVWSKLGLNDEQIRSYFTGPAHLPWHRMSNVDYWQSPLPKSWLEQQEVLQKQILKRERDFNMTPVLPAFSGHVPKELKAIYPDAKIHEMSQWGGYDSKYRSHFIEPMDSLFNIIQKMYLEEQTAIYGTDHIYGIDPFNEVDSPNWNEDFLAKVSKKIYESIYQVDAEAKWLQMTWMFYHDRKLWTAPRVKALLTGVPSDKLVLLDYHCENVELWKSTEKFHGQPYIWCYLGNFGGNTTLTGNVKESGDRLDNALINGGDNLKGIGSTLEGLDINQFPYEYIFEKAWTIDVNGKDWVERLADRHVGAVSESVREAWQILFEDVFVQVPRTLGILPGYRPKLGDNYNKRISNEYDNATLLRVWELLLEVPSCDRDAFEIDVIMTGRQLLGNYFLDVKKEFDGFYKKRNVPGLKEKASEMREILSDLELLNSFHNRASLDKWIEDARSLGDTDELKNYYEKNARNLITTWGGSLNDYASRTWAGLLNDYYAKRWEIYFDAVIGAAEKGIELNKDELKSRLATFEQEWVDSTTPIQIHREGSLLDTARHLLEKYGPRIEKSL